MESNILFRNETIIITKHFDVGQDWEIPIPGFFIVSSIAKRRSISDFSDEELIEFINLVCRIRKGMEEVLGIKDVYLFQNEDSSHNFHFWMFPRHDRMEIFGRKIQSVRPIMEYAQKEMHNEETYNEVKKYVLKMKNYMLSSN